MSSVSLSLSDADMLEVSPSSRRERSNSSSVSATRPWTFRLTLQRCQSDRKCARCSS